MNKTLFKEYKNIMETSNMVHKAELEGEEDFPYYKVYTDYLLPNDDYLTLYVMPDEECRFLYLHDQRNIYAALDGILNITLDDIIREVEALGMEDWGHGEIMEIKGDNLYAFEKALNKYFKLCDLLIEKYKK